MLNKQTPSIKISLSALLNIITTEMTSISVLEVYFEAFDAVLFISNGFMEGKCVYDPYCMEIISITRHWEKLIEKKIAQSINKKNNESLS